MEWMVGISHGFDQQGVAIVHAAHQRHFEFQLLKAKLADDAVRQLN
jgi:hypothetical protein